MADSMLKGLFAVAVVSPFTRFRRFVVVATRLPEVMLEICSPRIRFPCNAARPEMLADVASSFLLSTAISASEPVNSHMAQAPTMANNDTTNTTANAPSSA